jgi:hypothetical protein
MFLVVMMISTSMPFERLSTMAMSAKLIPYDYEASFSESLLLSSDSMSHMTFKVLAFHFLLKPSLEDLSFRS